MTKRPAQQEVELNVTAMLDMAFQLLAFFIMTFQAPRPEGQIAMHLPPAEAIGGQGFVDSGKADMSAVKAIETLAITLRGDHNRLTSVAVGLSDKDSHTIAFDSLDAELNDCFNHSAGAFKQVVVKSSPDVRWDYVMKTMEVCARQKKADGTRLDKLSFVALAAGQ